MRETPYSSEEERVSEYIQEITEGMIGSGEDPIGFLIASHHMLLSIAKTQIPGGMLQALINEVGSFPPTA